MKQFTHISIQQVHYSGSVENTVAFYDEAARQLAIANAAPQLVEALGSLLGWAVMRSDWAAAGKSEPTDHPIQRARAALKAAGEYIGGCVEREHDEWVQEAAGVTK